jgi:hypothetical protein
VDDLFNRERVCDLDTVFTAYRSGAGTPVAELAAHGSSLAITCWQP